MLHIKNFDQIINLEKIIFKLSVRYSSQDRISLDFSRTSREFFFTAQQTINLSCIATMMRVKSETTENEKALIIFQGQTMLNKVCFDHTYDKLSAAATLATRICKIQMKCL